MEPSYVLTDDGQETQFEDFPTFGMSAGLADDRVLAEILHLAPFYPGSGGIVQKRIIPLMQTPLPAGKWPAGATQYLGTVQPNGATGSVLVYPFRAIIGSRNNVAVVPADNASYPNPANQTAALASWRDIRSGIFIPTPTSLATALAIAANGSGTPRWDLVYATIQIDSSSVATAVRRVKDPASGNISSPSVPSYLLSPVSVSIVTGTPSATPAIPALPADTTGQYNIPLCLIRVPNGFGSTTTVAPQDIRPHTVTSSFDDTSSRFDVSPCNGNNESNNAGAAGANAFNVAGSQYYNPATSGQRPGAFLPPEWHGGVMKAAFVDTSSTNPSHKNGTIVDSGIDWRNRIFRVWVTADDSQKFCTDSTVVGTVVAAIPTPIDAPLIQMSNSMVQDDIGGLLAPLSGKSVIMFATPSQIAAMASSSQVALYVDPTTGSLYWYDNGTPSGCRFAIWIDASAIMANV